MSTLPPPKMKVSLSNSLEIKIYDLVENFREFIPRENDRNRLAYSLFLFAKGEGDLPEVSVKSSKILLNGISEEELAQKLSDFLSVIKVL